MRNTFGIQLCNNTTSNTHPRFCSTVYHHGSRLFNQMMKINGKQYNRKLYYALVSRIVFCMRYTDAVGILVCVWKMFVFAEPQKMKSEYAPNRVMHTKYSNECE